MATELLEKASEEAKEAIKAFDGSEAPYNWTRTAESQLPCLVFTIPKEYYDETDPDDLVMIRGGEVMGTDGVYRGVAVFHSCKAIKTARARKQAKRLMKTLDEMRGQLLSQIGDESEAASSAPITIDDDTVQNKVECNHQ